MTKLLKSEPLKDLEIAQMAATREPLTASSKIDKKAVSSFVLDMKAKVSQLEEKLQIPGQASNRPVEKKASQTIT